MSEQAPALQKPENGLRDLRLISVVGDSMEPTLRRGDFALALPISDWAGAGLYVLHPPYGGEEIFRVEKIVARPSFGLLSDNGRYSAREVPSKWFLAAVAAKIVFTVNVVDRHLAGTLQWGT